MEKDYERMLVFLFRKFVVEPIQKETEEQYKHNCNKLAKVEPLVKQFNDGKYTTIGRVVDKITSTAKRRVNSFKNRLNIW